MPFKSKAQARAAFGGYLGPTMKAKAAEWEDETPGGIKNLPAKVEGHPSRAIPGLGHTRHHLTIDRKNARRDR
jgi:hypothetical protein